MSITTSQLTFYDMVDGEVSFTIYSNGVYIEDINGVPTEMISLHAEVTEKGEEITDGTYTWYYSSDSFTDAQYGEQNIEVPLVENIVYRCDFTYATSETNTGNAHAAYTAYFNLTNRRMVYTAYPGNEYLRGDLWIVGDDYVQTNTDGVVDSAFDASQMTGTMLIATQSAGGLYKSTDWEEALDYNEQISKVQGDIVEVRNNMVEIDQTLKDTADTQKDLLNRIKITGENGIQIYGGSIQDDKWVQGKFYAQFESNQLTFFFNGQPT